MTSFAFVDRLGARIADSVGNGILRVGVTGADSVDKTRLADAVALDLRRRGLVVIRSSLDGFYNPRAIRYARGRDDPEGFFRDSFDLDVFRRELLDPLSPGGSGRYRIAWFDHVTDARIPVETQKAPQSAVLIVDGLFLMQPALTGYWDLSIHLEAPVAATIARMAARDGGDPDPDAAVNRRYRVGQQIYVDECRPAERADIVVDYADPERPEILKQ